VTIAVSKLAERGSLIRRGDEWLILEPPGAPVSTEPTAPHLVLTARGSSVWAARDPVDQGPDELRVLIQQVGQAREAFARDRRRSRDLAEEARALREQARRLRAAPGKGS
jgi:hypothetical protein